ncbi:hypothetical protein RQP46_010729 [Phenoliferia psychrophenolica]
MRAQSDLTLFTENGVTLAGSDLSVVSSDGVKFQVHKRHLACASEIFNDMLEVGGSGDEVTLVESAAVLARLLPFAYPKVIPPFSISFPEDLCFIQAINKYQISRATESVAQCLQPVDNSALAFAVLAAQTASQASDAILFHLWMLRTLEHFKNQTTGEMKTQLVLIEGLTPGFAAQLLAAVTGYFGDVRSILYWSRLLDVPVNSGPDNHGCNNENALDLWWRQAEDKHTMEALKKYSELAVRNKRACPLHNHSCAGRENAATMALAAREVGKLRMSLDWV